MENYKINWENSTGTFLSDNKVEYIVSLSHYPKFFGCDCHECVNITELEFLTTADITSLKPDPKVIRTMKGLIESRLDKVCNAVYYRCHNGDGRGKWREDLFTKMFEWHSSKMPYTVEMVEIVNEGEKYFLILNADCPNSLQIKSNFKNRFKLSECSKNAVSTDLTGDLYCRDSCGKDWLRSHYEQEHALGRTCGC